MRLYIAEKPSVGREIAKEMGNCTKGNGYIKTGKGIVTWAFGHILQQAEPEEYDEKYKIWRNSDLPIIPKQWKLLITPSCQAQFAIIKELVQKADEIVNAGDPDREGQLLIDEILDYLGNKKPVRRLLLNALDTKSIQTALADLRDNRDFFPLQQSALARSRADWIIGMNLSRAFTLAVRSIEKKKIVLPVGRVKTPTLALVVRREKELQDFKPVDYFVLKAIFDHDNGEFTAIWKAGELQAGLDSEGRLVDVQAAAALQQKFEQTKEDGTIAAYSKTLKKEAPLLPFSLSSLQVMAGKRFGCEPQQVLDAAQSLYEKKLTTYPRSDCEYLPQNQWADSKIILGNVANSEDAALAAWAAKAKSGLKSRAWNDKKITAHHAIIPTRVKPNWQQLTTLEKNIYFLVARQYVAQFYPEHVYEQVKAAVNFAEEQFQVSGRTEKQLGWRELFKSNNEKSSSDEGSATEDEAANLPAMKKGDSVSCQAARQEKKTTKPPARFTPATLLAGMKNIHKYVQAAAVKKRLRSVSGIGTEATRATIIDEMIQKKLLVHEKGKKTLQPSAAAVMMIDVLPPEITYPDFTAEWEDYLECLSHGEGSLEEFLQQQGDFVRKMCPQALSLVSKKLQKGTLCPRCGTGMLQQRKGKNGVFWGCSSYPDCRYTCNDAQGQPQLRPAGGSHVAREAFASGFVSAQDLIKAQGK